MTDEEKKEWDAKMRRMDAQVAHYYAAIEKMSVENAKLQAATAKLSTENQWYVAVVASSITSAVILASITLTKLFL